MLDNFELPKSNIVCIPSNNLVSLSEKLENIDRDKNGTSELRFQSCNI